MEDNAVVVDAATDKLEAGDSVEVSVSFIDALAAVKYVKLVVIITII